MTENSNRKLAAIYYKHVDKNLRLRKGDIFLY